MFYRDNDVLFDVDQISVTIFYKKEIENLNLELFESANNKEIYFKENDNFNSEIKLYEFTDSKKIEILRKEKRLDIKMHFERVDFVPYISVKSDFEKLLELVQPLIVNSINNEISRVSLGIKLASPISKDLKVSDWLSKFIPFLRCHDDEIFDLNVKYVKMIELNNEIILNKAVHCGTGHLININNAEYSSRERLEKVILLSLDYNTAYNLRIVLNDPLKILHEIKDTLFE